MGHSAALLFSHDKTIIIADDEITEEEATVVNAINHYVVEINGVRCTLIQPGENLASISRRYDIAPADLLKYNELAKEGLAKEGDIIYLDKKKTKYTGSQDVYISRGGESLHDVAQQFGIQLKPLGKLNALSQYALLDKGQRIYLK